MIKKSIFFLVCFAYSAISFAQEQSFESWLETAVSKDLNDSYTVDIVAEARFKQTGALLKSLSGELGVSYKLSKPTTLGIGYKLTQKNREQGFFPSHTISLNFAYKEKIGSFRIAYRNKLELNKDTYYNEPADLFPSYEDRNRLKVTYGKKREFIRPSLSIETFHPLQNGAYYITETRYGAGLSFNLKHKFECGLDIVLRKTYN